MPYKIEFRIGVAAPVDDVYDVIADIEKWPEWSPIHKKASGKMSFGAPIAFEEYYEGLGTWEINGVLADWQPLSHIHISVPKKFYEGRLVRYFEMDALSEAGSSFSVGALFDGFLSEREGRRYGKFLKIGFESFADAVKNRAEKAYAEAPVKRRAHLPPPEPQKPNLGPPPRAVEMPHMWGRKKQK